MGCAKAMDPCNSGWDDPKNRKFLHISGSAHSTPGLSGDCPVRHIRSPYDMQEIEYEELIRLVKVTQQAIKQSADVEYLTMAQEESAAHFQYSM